MRRLISLLLQLAVLSLMAVVPEARAVTLSIAPAETSVTVGDPITLRIVVDAVPDLKGADLIYGYTPGRLTFTSAQIGGALAGIGGATFEFVFPEVTPPADSVWYNAARLSGTGSGPGVVAFLEFTTHTQGNATVNCLMNDLRDSLNNELPAPCVGALIHIVGPVPARASTWSRVKSLYR